MPDESLDTTSLAAARENEKSPSPTVNTFMPRLYPIIPSAEAILLDVVVFVVFDLGHNSGR